MRSDLIEMCAKERDETSRTGGPDDHSVAGASWRDERLGQFLHNRKLMMGLLLAVFIALAVTIGPVIHGGDPVANNLTNRLQPPGASHPLGTDQLGRDVLARVLRGGQVSLAASLGAVLLSAVVGVLAGLISGYFGSPIDDVLMRIVDIQLAFPFILFALILVMVLGRELISVVIVLATTGWVYYARPIRGEVLSVREREFIVAARSVGATDRRIILKHILPNVMATVLVISSIRVGITILTESALSFLGIGLQPPLPSWGRDLFEGRRFLSSAWWVGIFPGLAVFLAVAAVNLIGEGLQEIQRPDRDTG